MQEFNFQLGFDVYFVVVLSLLPVYSGLAVLAHHDGGCGVSRLERQKQIQQNKWVRVPSFIAWGQQVVHNPSGNQKALDDDEAPRPHHRSHLVSQALRKTQRLRRHIRNHEMAWVRNDLDGGGCGRVVVRMPVCHSVRAQVLQQRQIFGSQLRYEQRRLMQGILRFSLGCRGR